MENTGYQRPEKFVSIFRESVKIHSCGFDPEPYLEDIPADINRGTSPSCYLPVAAKRAWFYSYCEKNQKVGQIIPNIDIRFDMECGNGVKMGYAVGTCDVYIDGVIRGSAQAGQSFRLDSEYQLDNVIQGVTGLAQSKALTNAGFGIVSGTDLEIPGASGLPGSFAQPATPGMETTSRANDVTPTPPAAPSCATNTAAAPQQGAVDDLQAAKSVMWPFSGPYGGKTLGELLAVKPDKIEYLALKWQGSSPAKDAAMRLLPDALKAMGKPIPAN